MDTSAFFQFLDKPDVSSLAVLSDILNCPISKLESIQHQIKSLASGPPYRVGIVVMELLARKQLSLEDIGQNATVQPTGALLAVCAQLVNSSLREASFGEFFENVLADPSLRPVLLQGDSERFSDAVRMSGGVKKKKWTPVDKNDRLVLALAKPMTAALFFDRVWTLDREIPGSIGFRCGDANEQIALGLLDGVIEDYSGLVQGDKTSKEVLDKSDEFLASPESELQLAKAFYSLLTPAFEKLTNRPVHTYFASDENLRSTYTLGSTPMVIAAFETFDWIDEQQLNWDQVEDIRQDKEALLAMKRMLHWIDTTMAGKPLSFVADEIQLRRSEYEKATRKHGISLVRGAFGTLLDVKLWNSLLGTIVGASIDPSRGPLIGFLAGVTLQGCRVAIETLNLHLDLKTKLEESPVAFIHHLESRVRDEVN